MAVDIGIEVLEGNTTMPSAYTMIIKDKAASVGGLITSIDVWAAEDMAGLRVGTFYTTNGNTLKCRDSEAIPGTITAGSKVTKTVSIAVEVGDYIGCYWTSGSIERWDSGYVGFWWLNEELIDPNDEATYDFLANEQICLGGYIEAEAVGRSFGFILG